MPSEPLHSSSLHATIAYSPTSPTHGGENALVRAFLLIAKCLQASQRGRRRFQAMRWPAGFGTGQLWWRRAFYCAVSLYVWPLPEYKSLGSSVGGTSTSQPPTHGTASFTNAGKDTQTHTAEHPEPGPSPCPTHPGKTPSAWVGGGSPNTRAQINPPHINTTLVF